jgi:hypothetical protein
MKRIGPILAKQTKSNRTILGPPSRLVADACTAYPLVELCWMLIQVMPIAWTSRLDDAMPNFLEGSCLNAPFFIYFCARDTHRDVAQLGSALRSGRLHPFFNYHTISGFWHAFFSILKYFELVRFSNNGVIFEKF